MTRKIFGARRLWYSGNGIQTNLDFRYDAQTDRLIFSPIDFSHKPGGLDHGNDPQPDEQPYIELIASVLEADINALPALRIDCSGGEDSVSSADLFLGASYDWHWVKARRKVTIEAQKKNQTLVFDLSAARDENGLLSLAEDTTVKIILLPFGGKCKPGDTFSIRFAGFFSDAAGAFAFDENKESHILADCPQPYGKAFFEEAPLGSEKAEKFKKILDDRIREIVGCPSALKPEDIYARGGKCYFFSSLRGDDANDGLTPDTPKASMQALKDLDEVVRPGDAVFFERGSLWRSCLKTRYSGTYCFAVRHGVSYGAYGEGEKPRFYGSVSGKGAEKWQQTEYPNVWRFYRPFDQISSLGAVTRGFSDVGNIVFDGGKNWGIKIVPTSAKDGLSPTVPNGQRNGFQRHRILPFRR